MSDKGPAQRAELFVRSIPADATEEQLAAFFGDFAPVRHAVVVKDHEGNSRGFGFVSFAEADDAKTALETAKKTKFQGRILNVEVAMPRNRQPRKEGQDATTTTNKEKTVVEKRKPRLIIRNLPWSCKDKNTLIKLFSKYGKVVDAIIPRKDHGKMAGFAFVTMKKRRHADKAIEGSKGLKIDGREVAVDFAVQKDKWLNGQTEEDYDDSESESDSEDNDDSGDENNKDDEEGDDNDMDVEEAGIEGLGEDDDSENESENEDDSEDDIDLSSDEEDNEDEPPRKTMRGASNNCTVFVRNVPYDATAEDLAEHFEQFGPVRYALPVMDKQLNQPKGTAFVAFRNEEDAHACVQSAPATAGSSSLLLADDADPRYVYEGRILSVTQAVERERADKLQEASAKKRAQMLGKEPDQKDKRRLFLLNEGRIPPGSKLAEGVPASELEIRQKSFDLRKQQLAKNPSLHLSATRLAIRNLPRVMNQKALKALARKAVVSFATEVKDKKRQPLTKEEVHRSVRYSHEAGEPPKSKHGVVRQAKIITELKGSGELGRSKGYGFVEFRNHKAALMGLRWLNTHQVTRDEILEGYDKSEHDKLNLAGSLNRRLVVEFAIEHAKVVKRRRENLYRSRDDKPKPDHSDAKSPKGRPGKPAAQNKPQNKQPDDKEAAIKRLIGKKRKFRKQKGGK